MSRSASLIILTNVDDRWLISTKKIKYFQQKKFEQKYIFTHNIES